MKKGLASLILAVMLVATSAVQAQADIGLKGIGGRLGFVSIESNIGSTLTFGAVADLGTIIPNLGLQANVDFWTKSDEASSRFGTTTATVKSSWRDITLSGRALYEFPVSSPTLTPFAGGGLAFHFYSFDVEYSDNINNPFFNDLDTSSSDLEIGVDLGGGAKFAMSPKMDILAEAYYRIGGADHFAIAVALLFGMGG